MATRAGEPRVPMTLQRARLKAEEKILDFEFEVVNVQFNEKGRYALRLTVENLLLEGSGAGVRLRVNEGDVLYTSSGTTDIIEQSNLSEIHAFQRRRFIFTLPRGFCKNDKNHDARLRIEALRLRGPSLKSSLRAGEAFFAIYPRTNQPRMNLFASRDEDLYHYSDIMVLLRVGKDDLAMHCGRLAYTVSFHEHRPPVSKGTPVSSCQLSPWPNKIQTHVEVPSACACQVLEAPSEVDEAVRTSETNNWHLAHCGKESISVTLHGATNLPATRKGNMPWPYVTVKSSSDEEKKQEAQGVTHVSSEPTHSPTWEEKVTVEIDAEDAGHEAVTLTVADKITKEVLASYKIPVRYLRSFHHYHFRLVLVSIGQPNTHLDTCGYGGVALFHSPSVHQSPHVVFCLLFGLVTHSGGPPEKPTWNSSFLFQGRDGATLFSDDTALVIEYYPYQATENMPKPLGYSVLPLTSRVYRSLVAESNRSGVQVDNVPIQRPDTFLTPSNTDTLPILDPKLLGKLGTIRESWARSVSPVPQAEMDNYRTAMKKMADDILSLRRHVASLEAENSTLRCNLSMHEEVGGDLALWSLAVALKRKLAAGTVELSRMKDRVQQLQNELIRKNDREKDLVMLQRAHQQQQTVLRKYQEKITKMKALEDTVRQQERVIEKMERMLEEKVPEAARTTASLLCPPADSFSKTFYSTLLAENMRLREELGRSHCGSSPIILQQQALPVRWVDSGPWPVSPVRYQERFTTCAWQIAKRGHKPPEIFSTNSEKLSLLAKLEKAQGRIHVLESQLEESARKWGREKQDLSTQLLEQVHGFGRSSSTILKPSRNALHPLPTSISRLNVSLVSASSVLPLPPSTTHQHQ
uniref:Coiled-coil domain containing 33 n=1 Tax=Pelusios castaneus TaxID=367368 RepID=A0A8C8RJR9_9SAUR